MKSSVILILKSQTVAIKVKKLLALNGISASTVKRPSPSGCRFGILIPAQSVGKASAILDRQGISYTDA